MIVTIANTKGGVGKTTLAVNLAAARALLGHSVWLIDGDRQSTAETAIRIRAQQASQLFGVVCSNCPDGSLLREQVQEQAKKFDDVIIDAGGRDSSALRAALLLSDVVLLPLLPRSYDVWALSDMSKLVDDARGIRRDGLRCCVVLNCADAGENSRDNVEAAAAVGDFPHFEYLPTPLRRRKAFANAASCGQSVLETHPMDAKAISELKSLLKTLFND